MNRSSVSVLLAAAVLLAFAQRSPAPLIYTPGEGWRYESAGAEGNWLRGRAKDQLAIGQEAFEKKDFGLAAKAARRTVSNWPFSDYAPEAQYLLARCYEEEGKDEKAFKAYQKLVEKYPKLDNYDEVVKRQFMIANRFLAGKWFKLWDYVPVFPSMDRTIKLYDQIIKNGPYSEVAPGAQLNIGQAHEQKMIKDYPAAAKAYEKAADRYSDRKAGADALYRVGLAYNKQAKTAEYDQSIASQAIATFTDFMTLHPEDTRTAEAQKVIGSLKTEQARGSFDIAHFYETKHRWRAAVIYYNDVVEKDPNSPQAAEALKRIESIKKNIKE